MDKENIFIATITLLLVGFFTWIGATTQSPKFYFIAAFLFAITIIWTFNTAKKTKEINSSLSIVDYFKMLAKFDASKKETRSVEELKSDFESYFQKFLVNAHKNLMVYPKVIFYTFMIGYSILFMGLFAHLKNFQYFMTTNTWLCLTLTFFIPVAVGSLILRFYIAPIADVKHKGRIFIEFFDNFKYIPWTKMKLEFFNKTDNQEHLYFYVGNYKNITCAFSVVQFINSPSYHSYRLKTYINCDTLRNKFNLVLNSEEFASLFDYSFNENNLCLVSKKEVPYESIRRTILKIRPISLHARARIIMVNPFADEKSARLIFDMTMDVFELINRVTIN